MRNSCAALSCHGNLIYNLKSLEMFFALLQHAQGILVTMSELWFIYFYAMNNELIANAVTPSVSSWLEKSSNRPPLSSDELRRSSLSAMANRTLFTSSRKVDGERDMRCSSWRTCRDEVGAESTQTSPNRRIRMMFSSWERGGDKVVDSD